MRVRENADFTRDYYDPHKRFIGNAVQVFFADGSASERVAIDTPLGHRRRRAAALPLLRRKFAAGVRQHFDVAQSERITQLFEQRERLEALPVTDLMAALVLA